MAPHVAGVIENQRLFLARLGTQGATDPLQIERNRLRWPKQNERAKGREVDALGEKVAVR